MVYYSTLAFAFIIFSSVRFGFDHIHRVDLKLIVAKCDMTFFFNVEPFKE